jgi:FtsP/CotA-like multicopper oxidase with cupredoxin domain
MANRRSFLQSALGLSATVSAGIFTAATPHSAQAAEPATLPTARPTHHTNTPVITTDVGDLPYTLDNGVKVFELTAHVMQRQIAPNKTIDVWGFNGSAPGPTIQVTQGDRVRVIFTNQLPEPSSIHWHGFEDHIGFDGMPGISQKPVLPGEQFVYEFTIHQEGTYFYHSHMAMQEMAGMLGAFIMHPRVPYTPHCDKDFVLHLQEYAVLPSSTIPNTSNMEYNWLVLNGRSGPAATPLVVRQGERVRIRFVNLGMDHHPMHIHGHTFQVTGTEGGRIPQTAWWPGNTVLVGVAQARAVEFVANNPGDWMLHCHLPHHMMNQMSSQAMIPGGDQSTVTNGPLSPAANAAAMQAMPGIMPGIMPGSMSGSIFGSMPMPAARDTSPHAANVPGFPQDAYMEGPMMQMDAMVQKPENFGLRPGWSQYMQGMMTFLRVLPPESYDAILTRMRQAARPSDPYASLWS